MSFVDPVERYAADPFPLSPTAMLAPFWGDVDTRGEGAGQIFYRQTNDTALLSQARTDVLSVYPAFTSFSPTNLLIATWDHVGHYDSEFFFSGLVSHTQHITENTGKK